MQKYFHRKGLIYSQKKNLYYRKNVSNLKIDFTTFNKKNPFFGKYGIWKQSDIISFLLFVCIPESLNTNI